MWAWGCTNGSSSVNGGRETRGSGAYTLPFVELSDTYMCACNESSVGCCLPIKEMFHLGVDSLDVQHKNVGKKFHFLENEDGGMIFGFWNRKNLFYFMVVQFLDFGKTFFLTVA